MQSEAESLIKVKTESLKNELSELQSEMMIKATQIRKLTDENNLLKKHLNKLKEKEENKVKFLYINITMYVCTVCMYLAGKIINGIDICTTGVKNLITVTQ